MTRYLARDIPNRFALALAALVLLVGVGAATFGLLGKFDVAQVLTYGSNMQRWSQTHPVVAAAAYVLVYVVTVALSLPLASILTALGGATFGLWLGVPLAASASVAGGTLAMLVARYGLRDIVQRRFGDRLRVAETDIARTLFGLRLVPVIPFFVVNLAMGLTTIPVFTFAWVSLLGQLPATTLYVNAGRQLGGVAKPGDIFSLPVIVGLLALAALPFVAKAAQTWWTARTLLRRWTRPKSFDCNLAVIGGGSAGLVAAYLTASARGRAVLIEEGAMGGECLNTGCVPSKTLIRSAKLAKDGRTAGPFGLAGRLEPDFGAVMARVAWVIDRVAPHDSEERYRALGVDVIKGRAFVVDPWTVAVAGRRLTARRIVIATGASPSMPAIPGLDVVAPLTSDTLWSLTERPPRLLVLGGGGIGCELAQAFARLGSRTTLVEAKASLLAGEDPEVGEVARQALEDDGVMIHLGTRVTRFEGATVGQAYLANGDIIPFDRVVVAVGRTPRVSGFGLEELGLLEDGKLVVDASLRTRLPSIYAAGDVLGQLQFTHAAGRYGWYAAANALLGGLKSWRATMKAFPAVFYTDPEIARVGLTEREAKRTGVAYEVTRFDLGEFDRAIIEGAGPGFIKVLTPPGKDTILGVTIVSGHAGDMLTEFTLAMRHGLGLKAILATIHPYPGWTEAAASLAGQWRRAHVPTWTLALSAWFLRRQRG